MRSAVILVFYFRFVGVMLIPRLNNSPLDDIFDDPATALQTTSANPEGINKDEGPLPSTYGFAGTSQLDENHHFPPTEEGDLVSKGYNLPTYIMKIE